MQRALIVFILIGLLFMAACGNGGGEGGDGGSSNWDEMVWDQDDWT